MILYGHCYQTVTDLDFWDFFRLSEVVRVYYRGSYRRVRE